MASYDFDYAIKLLRQAIDHAEGGGDFGPLRRQACEVEQSGHDLEAIEVRLNLPSGQDVLLAALRSVAAGSIPPEEALQFIRCWLNNGQVAVIGTELTPVYQFT